MCSGTTEAGRDDSAVNSSRWEAKLWLAKSQRGVSL